MTLVQSLFDLSNLIVLPFWGLMILLPNWQVTRWVMQSYWPLIGLASVYVYLLIGTLTGETAQAMANPTLSTISQFFGDERAAATGWTHFLVMDLFVGRWIYWEGQQTQVWTIHSIALCLFAGPLGLLSHLLTATIHRWATQREDAPTQLSNGPAAEENHLSS
jgi:hypothetical protein